MNKWKWLGLTIGGSLMGSVLMALPAGAQQNLSDITGTNVYNNVVPLLDGDARLSEETISEARRLSQELDDKFPCEVSAVGPRRFARGPADPNEVCVASDCQDAEGVLREAKQFLADTNRQVELIRKGSSYRPW